MWVLAAVDGNTVGLGSVSVALVTALGYMLKDRRDSDARVDRATAAVVETVTAQRDAAIAAQRAAEDRLAEVEEQLQIARYRIHDLEVDLRAKGQP